MYTNKGGYKQQQTKKRTKNEEAARKRNGREETNGGGAGECVRDGGMSQPAISLPPQVHAEDHGGMVLSRDTSIMDATNQSFMVDAAAEAAAQEAEQAAALAAAAAMGASSLADTSRTLFVGAEALEHDAQNPASTSRNVEASMQHESAAIGADGASPLDPGGLDIPEPPPRHKIEMNSYIQHLVQDEAYPMFFSEYSMTVDQKVALQQQLWAYNQLQHSFFVHHALEMQKIAKAENQLHEQGVGADDGLAYGSHELLYYNLDDTVAGSSGLSYQQEYRHHQPQAHQRQPTSTPAAPTTARLSRGRWAPTAEQLAILEKNFTVGLATPGKKKILQLVDELAKFGDITEKNIYNWFQNNKARRKPKEPKAGPAKDTGTKPKFIKNNVYDTNFYISKGIIDPATDDKKRDASHLNGGANGSLATTSDAPLDKRRKQ